MKRIESGTRVAAGYYWSPRRWGITHVGPEAGQLPGEAGESFVRLPFGLLMLVAPVMGLVYVMFLPLIGFAMVLGLLGRLALRGVRYAIASIAAIVHPAWRPGEAYLTGKRHDDAGGERDAAVDALSKEVDARRKKD